MRYAKHLCHGSFAALAWAACSGIAAPAFAQTASGPVPATPAATDTAQATTATTPEVGVPAISPAAQPAPTADTGALRDIVVTAQRRQDRLQSIPAAVTAFDSTALASPIVNDIRDLTGRAPGLVIDSVSSTPGGAAISIRGISFEDIEKSFDPAVGVVVDGVVIGTNTNQLLDSFDLQRLEVLRGPQGTLFGRNTIGGVVSVTRTRPTDEAGVRASFGYSSYDTKRGRLVVNTGKITDWLALKGFAFWDATGGYYYNVTKQRHDGRDSTLNGGITALVTPASNVTAIVTYEHQHERGEAVVTSLSNSLDVICFAPGAPGFASPNECNRNTHGDVYTTFTPQATPVRSDVNAVTSNIDVTLGRYTLTSVTGYRDSTESVTQDFDASTANFYSTVRPQVYSQFSQELRATGDITDTINLLVGAYYFTSHYTFDGLTNLGPALTGGGSAQILQHVDHHSDSYAGFADARWKITDKFSLGGGARYTEDEKRIFNNYGQIVPLVQLTQPGFTGTQCVQATGTVQLAPGVVVPAYSPASNCNGKASFGKFTWRANVNYQFDPHRLVYASYSKGFRSGGFNGRATSPTSLGPYNPETVDAYEVGLKADWLDRTLRTNIAVYRSEYHNKQEEIVQPAPAGSASPQETVVKNAASARIQGVEIEAIAQPVRAISFTATLSYIDAKYTNFLNDVNGDNVPDNVSTLMLRRAPKWQWTMGIDYSHALGHGKIEASTEFRYISSYYTCIIPNRPIVLGAVINDARCATGDIENLSAEIGYSINLTAKRQVKLSVFGRNLTDNRGVEAVLPVAGLFTFATARPPRTVGVEFGFNF